MSRKKTAEQPMKIVMLGYEVVEKVATRSGNSSRVYLPVDWTGKRVRAVRLEK
jgi:putative transposon-encoded protein